MFHNTYKQNTYMSNFPIGIAAFMYILKTPKKSQYIHTALIEKVLALSQCLTNELCRYCDFKSSQLKILYTKHYLQKLYFLNIE